MNNQSTSVAVSFLICALLLQQCSSAKKQGASAQAIPDVSQISSSHTKESTSPEVVMFGQPKFYGKDSVTLEAVPTDSLLTKRNAQNSGPRILHIASHGKSVYDTRYDSTRLKPGADSYKKKQDTAKYNYDTDVGILTAEEAMKLSVNLSKAEIITLSLVDSELFNNFEKEDLEQKFTHYGAKYILLTVAEKDSYQRTSFVAEFYKDWMSSKDYGKAFEKAMKSAKAKNTSLDFKARLIKK